MDSTPLRSNTVLQASLTNSFCYLISSLDDSNVQVAQRATLYLGTIHDTALKVNVIYPSQIRYFSAITCACKIKYF